MTRKLPALRHNPVSSTRAGYEADQSMLPVLDAAHMRAEIPSFAELSRLHPYPPSSPDEALPALEAPTSPLGAGGEFTDGRKVALLKMRGSDWSNAVVAHLEAFGKANCEGKDYRDLAARGFAINKGSFHVLTQRGRMHADQVAFELARSEGMHVITFDPGRRGYGAAVAKCTCGWRSNRSQAIRGYEAGLSRDAHRHLRFVGATAEECASSR